MNKIKTIPLCIAFMFSVQANAHDIAAPNVDVGPEKIDPLPSTTTSKILEKDLTRLRTQTSDTARLLDGEPGVSLYQAGGVSSMPVIRGLADDRIRIKVDGMDLMSACANHMNTPLSYIDPANVSSIKVYAGVTPVSVGGDSIGGTIKVESAAPEFAEPGASLLHKGQVGTFYRSNNDARGANFSATIANDVFSAKYTGSVVEANNYKAGGDFKPAWTRSGIGSGLSADTVGSSAYKSENHALDLAFKHDNHLFDFKIGVQNIPYQGFPNQRMDMTKNNSEQFNFKYTGQHDWGNLVANIYHQNTRHSMNFRADKKFDYSGAPGMPMETKGENTGASLRADIAYTERDLFKVGAEYQRYRLDDWWPASQSSATVGTNTMMGPNAFQNINNGQRDRYDVFAEWEAKWSKEWMTQFGLRSSTVKMDTGNVHGYYNGAVMGNTPYGDPSTPSSISGAFNTADRSRTDNNIDATAIARWTPDSTKILEAGYSMKTRSPNLYERYTWSSKSSMDTNMNNWVGDGNGYVGNMNLKPETAHILSVTGELHDAQHEQWNLRVSPYFSYVTDYIDAVSCPTVHGVNCPAPRGDGFLNLSLANQTARLYGVDVSSNLILGNTGKFGDFKVMGVVNYVRGKNVTTGDDLYNIMPLNGKIALEQRLGAWINTAEVKLVTAKDDVSDVRKEMRTPGYGVLNFYSSYNWEKMRLDVGVENVFDKYYYYPLGGAYLGQGATMSSNATAPQYGTPVPSMGRSINVGLTINF